MQRRIYAIRSSRRHSVSEKVQDELWPHFVPLWNDMNDSVGKSLLVAGGYGLFLKQNWLLGNQDVPIIVPVGEWRDNTPRATKDLDLVIGLDLIAEEKFQKEMLRALEKHDFKVSELHPRWQFFKNVTETRKVIVELHAPLPAKGSPGLQADRIRVKRKPSLGSDGIHGRTNPEAIGCDLQPFKFELEGMEIPVPNPVTWSIMKLTAAHERWAISQDPNQKEELRTFSRVQAIKHAQDVCRVVAMVTRGESDTTNSVLDAIRTAPEFLNAAQIFANSFSDDEQWVAQVLADNWSAANFMLIRTTLGTWFK